MSRYDSDIRPPHAGYMPVVPTTPLTSADGVTLSLDLDEILKATCKFAADLLKVDHSGLMVFLPGRDAGHVISESPPYGTKGLTIPLRGLPAGAKAADFEQPILIPDISQDGSFGPVGEILGRRGIQSVLLVPLISKGRLVGSLGLDMIGRARAFTPVELKLCESLAEQAAAVIELYEQNRQRAEQFAAIRHTVLAVNTKEDLRSVLDTITSQAVQIVGAEDGGISQFHPERGELTVIADYKFPTFIGKTIKMGEGLAGHVMREDLPFKAVDDYNEWQGRAGVFAETERFGAVLMVNLKWQNRTVGVLYINAARRHAFPDELPPMLSLLAGTAALAIANSRLLHEVEIARMRVRSTYEVSSALATLTDSGQALQEIANNALRMADAEWVRLMLMDESVPRRNFIASSGGKLLPTDNRVRPNGISVRVLKTGRPYRCENTDEVTEELNPAMLEEGSRAALCLPLSCRGRHLGVIWCHYSQPRKFSKRKVEALTAHLSDAVIAYDNAYQMEEKLDPLWLAAEGVAAVKDPEEVLERIVTKAQKILGADYAIFFPDPDSQQGLLVERAVTAGVPESLREEVKSVILPVGEITRGAMREGWVGIDDIDNPTRVAFPQVSLDLLHRLEAKSVEGLGLKIGDEELGILYLVYKNRRDFHWKETYQARTFAYQAALALEKVKLADQVTRAHRAARRVTEVMALGKPEDTFQAVVESTKEVLKCDAVTLYGYDESKDRILPLTTLVGVRFEEEADRCQNAPRDALVYRMLKRDKPYCVRDVSKNEIFRDRPFVTREGIKSVCVIPLKVGDSGDQRNKRVGVMFVNYRSEHPFPDEELEIIELFANQAAVAIRNTLDFWELKKRLDEQQRLMELSEKLLGADDEDKTLELAIDFAAESLDTNFIAIVMPDDDGRLRFRAWKAWTDEEVAAYKQGRRDRYQAGYTMKQDEPVLVIDYAKERRFTVPRIVKMGRMKSGMSVRMLSPGGEPLGVMLSHYGERRTENELKELMGSLSLIANLTAISIQHHRAVQSKIASLDAVRRASDEISSIRFGTDRGEVLDRIVEEAVRCLPQAFMGTIQLYDKETNELRFESVYSQEKRDKLRKLVGGRRPLVRRPELKGNKGRIGIVGRAVIDKAPQLVDDVSADPDYFRYCDETKSELAVPLLTEDNEVLGVLNVESKRPAAFSKDDERALMALAKLVVATLQNAELYSLLDNAEQFRRYEETRKRLDSYFTLAWLGMASNDWGHSVATHATAIRGSLGLMRRTLNEHLFDPVLRQPLEDRISFIDEMVEKILQLPVNALLSLDAAPSDVSINKLITELVEQLRGDPKYSLRPKLNLTRKEPLVRCSPDWVRRMLNILIDNSVVAMKGSPAPRLTISTRVARNQVEIAISDTGPGIPPEIKHRLFRQVIDKPDGSGGLGIGMLMVQAIAQVYRGAASVGRTGPKGTTIYVRLPVVEHS